MKRIVMGLLALGLLLGVGDRCWAKLSLNSQGTSGAPISVSSAVLVIPANANRFNWTLYSEGAALRCTAGTYSQAAGTFTAPSAPTSSVGFYIPQASYVSEKQLSLGAYTSGSNAFTEDGAKVEIDCISLGSATSVDTWEELAR